MDKPPNSIFSIGWNGKCVFCILITSILLVRTNRKLMKKEVKKAMIGEIQ